MTTLTLIHILYFVLTNLAIIFVGYLFIKKTLVWQSWAMMVLSLVMIDFIFLQEGAVIRMLALIATTFTCMKVIAVTEGYKNNTVNLKFYQWCAFAGGWAGMRAQPFESFGNKPLPNAWPMIRFGVSRVLAGLLFIVVAHIIVALHLGQQLTYFVVTAISLIGLSLVLHFGLLSISAGMWRFSGVNTYFLFKEPAKAASLTEFWSKRWNIAFSEMTSIAIFRPLRSKVGNAAALMAAFAFSGLLHEIALSVPVDSGYGLPLLYFIIQGLLVLAEKLFVSRKITFLQNKFAARLWVFFWLVAPMPLLFHAQFIKQVVWPLVGLKL